MIAAIIAILVVVWKIATSTIAYKAVSSTEKYEAKRDDEVETRRWNSMWNDIRIFKNEFDKQNHCHGVYDIYFIANMNVWIFRQYGYSLDDLKKSIKDKKHVKWIESMYRQSDLFAKSKEMQEYSTKYTSSWVNDEKSRIVSNINKCNDQRNELEAKRHKERKDGLCGILIVICYFVAMVVACQSDSYAPAIIVNVVFMIYVIIELPNMIMFFKERS